MADFHSRRKYDHITAIHITAIPTITINPTAINPTTIHITAIHTATNTAIPGKQGLMALESPQTAARKSRPRIHHRRCRRRSFWYCNLCANGRNLRVWSTLARLVHLSVHDRYPADVRPDRNGNWERTGWRHSRALLKEGSVLNGLAARDREHDQHRRGSRGDGLLGADVAGAAESLLACPHYGVHHRP